MKKYFKTKKRLFVGIFFLIFVYLGISYAVYQHVYLLVLNAGKSLETNIIFQGKPELSWLERKFIIRNLEISDIKGCTWLQVKEGCIEFSGWLPKISKISLDTPVCNIWKTERNAWNFASIIPNTTKSPAHPAVFPKLGTWLSPSAEIKIYHGSLYITDNKLLQKTLEIRDIYWNAKRQGESEKYTLEIGCNNELTKKVDFIGTYEHDVGLTLKANQSCTIHLADIVAYLGQDVPLSQIWDKMKIQGYIEFENLELAGLTPENPGIDLNFHFSQTQGTFRREDICFDLKNIESRFSLERGSIKNLCVKMLWNGCSLEIKEGKKKSGNGHTSIYFELKNLVVSSHVVQIVEQVVGISLQQYYELLRPQGNFSMAGFVFYDMTTGWEWEIYPYVQSAYVQYKNCHIGPIQMKLKVEPTKAYIQKFDCRLGNGIICTEEGTEKKVISIPDLSLDSPIALELKNIQLNKDFIFSIPEISELWEILQPEGIIQGRVVWENSFLHLPHAHAWTKQLKAAFEEVPYPVNIHNAKISFQDGVLYLEEIYGKGISSPCDVYVHGKVWLLEKPHPIAYDVDFVVKEIELDATAYRTFTLDPNPNAWVYDIQSIWDNLRPEGKITVIGHVDKERRNKKPPNFDIKIQTHDAKVSYVEFPYTVSHVNGTIFIKPELVTFPKIQAKKDGGALTVDGKITVKPKQGLEVHMTVHANDLPLDHDLARALGPVYYKVWKQFDPAGKITLDVSLQKNANSPRVNWKAVASLLSRGKVTACYQDFPYRLHDITGTVHVAQDDFEFHDLVGKKNSHGQVKIRGFLKREDLQVKLEFQKIAIDPELRAALPQEGQELWKDFDCQGECNGTLWIERPSSKQKLLWRAEIELYNLAGKYLAFPYPLEQGHGKIQLAPSSCIIQEFFAKRRETSIQLSGKIIPNTIQLSILAQKVPLDATLYQALPFEQAIVWNEFSPSGWVDVGWEFLQSNDSRDTKIHIIPKGCNFIWKKFPYPIQELHTQTYQPKHGIYIHNGNVELHNVFSNYQGIQLEMQGHIFGLKDVKIVQDMTQFHILAKNLPMSTDLRKALMEYFPGIVKTWEPEGNIGNLRVKLSQYVGKEKYWQYQVTMHDLDVKMKKDSFIQRLSGDIECTGYSYQDKHHAQGKITNASVTIKNLSAQKCQSEIQYFQNYLFLNNITGNFYDGELTGNLVLDTSSYGAYKGFLSIQNARLAGISTALQSISSDPSKKKQKTNISGILQTELFFQGNRHNTDSLTGKGNLWLRDGEIWQFPLFLAILDLFSLPSRPAFREGEIVFSLFKSQILITSMRFDSSVLAISGKGNIDYDGNISLTLLTHFTSDLIPRIPFLDKIWDGLRRDLLAFSVQGPLSKPTITPKPIHDILDMENSQLPLD